MRKSLILLFVLFVNFLYAVDLDIVTNGSIQETHLSSDVAAKLNRTWGDMLKSTYDMNGDSVVDNSEKLNYKPEAFFAPSFKTFLRISVYTNITNEVTLEVLLNDVNEYDCIFLNKDVYFQGFPFPKYRAGDILQKRNGEWFKLVNFFTAGTDEVFIYDSREVILLSNPTSTHEVFDKYISLNNLKDVDIVHPLEDRSILLWNADFNKWAMSSLSQEVGIRQNVLGDFLFNTSENGINLVYYTNETNSSAISFLNVNTTTEVTTVYRFKVPNANSIEVSLSPVEGELTYQPNNDSLYLTDSKGGKILAGGKKVALSDHQSFYFISGILETNSDFINWKNSASEGDFAIVLDTIELSFTTLINGDVISKRGNVIDKVVNFLAAPFGSVLLGVNETGNPDDFDIIISNNYDNELGKIIELESLKDVDATTLSEGDILVYDGNKWLPNNGSAIKTGPFLKGGVYRSSPMIDGFMTAVTLGDSPFTYILNTYFGMNDLIWYVPDIFGISWQPRIWFDTSNSFVGANIAGSLKNNENIIAIYGGNDKTHSILDLDSNSMTETSIEVSYAYEAGLCFDKDNNLIVMGGSDKRINWKLSTLTCCNMGSHAYVYNKNLNYSLTKSVSLSQLYGVFTKEVPLQQTMISPKYPVVYKDSPNLYIKLLTIDDGLHYAYVRIYTSEVALEGSWNYVTEIKAIDHPLNGMSIFKQPNNRYILILQVRNSQGATIDFDYYTSYNLQSWVYEGSVKGLVGDRAGDGCSVTFNPNDNLYHLFIRQSTNGVIYHYTSTTGEVWSDKQALIGDLSGEHLAHPMCQFDVNDNLYKMFYFNYGDYHLYYAESSDGLNFYNVATYSPSDDRFKNEITRLYQMSFLYDSDECFYKFWEMAQDQNGVWGTAYMTGETITNFEFVEWQQVGALTTETATVDTFLSAANIHPVSYVGNDGHTKILLLGGLFEYKSSQDSIRELYGSAITNLEWDLNTGTTRELSSAELPITPLWFFDRSQQKVFFIGHYYPIVKSTLDSRGFQFYKITNEVYVYDIPTDTWITLDKYPDELPSQGTCVINNYKQGKALFVYNSDPEADYKSFLYDFATSQWVRNYNVASNLYIDLTSYNLSVRPIPLATPLYSYYPGEPMKVITIEEWETDHVIFTMLQYTNSTSSISRSYEGSYTFALFYGD